MRREARLLFFRQADPHVDFERLGDFIGEELSAGFSADAADHFAHEKPVGDEVIEVGRARLPEWRHLFQRRDAGFPIEQVARADAAFRLVAHEASGVREQVANQHTLFSGLGEFGPVLCDGRFEIELAAFGKNVGTRRNRSLGARHHDGDRVGGVGAVLLDVAAGPKIDDTLAVSVDTKLRAAAIERLAFGEALPHRLEARSPQSYPSTILRALTCQAGIQPGLIKGLESLVATRRANKHTSCG